MSLDPAKNCSRCTRLVDLRKKLQKQYPDFYNAPIPTWSANKNLASIELLILGLAPGLKGANRTGRPFTGDFAGVLLYETLIKFGFAKGEYKANINDGLKLHRVAITNAVRCLPPENKPVGSEINNCRKFLLATLAAMKNLKVIVTLGTISHTTLMKALGAKIAKYPFKHNELHNVGKYMVISSYHCSRYNTQTKRLTAKMFENVFDKANKLL